MPVPDHTQLLISAWEKTVDVQQHFNDLQMRIRNFAITLVVAVLGFAAVALKEGSFVSVWSLHVPLASLLTLAGLIGWGAFYFMDVHWYHRLLKGAVAHGTLIEKMLGEIDSLKGNAAEATPGPFGLSQSISAASPVAFLDKKMDSTQKAKFFYSLGAAVLLIFTASPIFVASRGSGSEISITVKNPTSATVTVPAPLEGQPQRPDVRR